MKDMKRLMNTNDLWKTSITVLCALSLLAAPPALAQEEDDSEATMADEYGDEDEYGDDEDDEYGDEADEYGDETDEYADDEDDEVMDVGPPVKDMGAAELKTHDLYWADKRKSVSIQKRSFLKDGRHEFTVHFGVIPNDEFFTYLPAGARYSYFFQEDVAIELWASYQGSIPTGLKASLIEKADDEINPEANQTLVMMGGINALWSPIHGKFDMFETVLGHFDAYITIGAGAVLTTVYDPNSKDTAEEPDVAGNVGLGFRIFLSDFISLRLDVRQYLYPSWKSDIAHPLEFTLGASFWTSQPE